MANVTLTMDAETAKAVQGFMRIEQKQQAIESGARKLAQTTSRGASRTTRKNAAWQSSLMAVAAGYLSVTAAAARAAAAVASVREERERSAQTGRDAGDYMGKLAQLAAGKPAEMKRMVSEVQDSMRRYGMTMENAARLQFSVESMGLTKPGQRRMLAGLSQVVEDPSVLAEGVSTIQNAFGRRETGGARGLLNKLLTASAVSKTTLEQFGPAATIAAKGVAIAGGTDEELLAAIAELSKSTKSADVAATQIAAFAAASSKKLGMTDRGIMARVRRLAGRGLGEADLYKAFGRQEAVKGFLALRDLAPQIQRTETQLHAAQADTFTPRDATLGARQAFMSNPILRAQFEERRAQAALRLAEMNRLGPRGLTMATRAAREDTRSIERGDSPMARAISQQFRRLEEDTGIKPRFTPFGPWSGVRMPRLNLPGASTQPPPQPPEPGVGMGGESLPGGLATASPYGPAGMTGMGGGKPVEVVIRGDLRRNAPNRNADTE